RRVLVRDKSILNMMWHPDVYFANARIAEFHTVTQPNFLVWIESDGSILYDTRISLVVLCTLNLEKWPLDSQRCNLRILSYAYDTDQLEIEWMASDPITRNSGIGMSDMHIIDLYPGLCDGNYSTGTWSCVTAEFHVKREITHHVMQSYVPTTLIVVISWFSFWLDVEAVPARVSLAITTLLTLSTQSSAARMALPEVSYMKAIDVWMGACMMFVFGVMIEFTIVNYAQRQGRKCTRSDMLNAEEEEKEREGGKISVSERARNLITRIRGHNEHHEQLVEESTPAPLRHFDPACSRFDMADSSVDDDEEEESNPSLEAGSETGADDTPVKVRSTAEKLANWNNGETKTTRTEGTTTSVWSKLQMQNGSANYGSVAIVAEEGLKHRNGAALTGNGETPKKSGGGRAAIGRAVSKLKNDRWTNVVRQIQKNKKEAGRNRAKRIDQKSRWMFPLTFIIFNVIYWLYYIVLT
ncbi:ggr-2, partial [Pristionchus pacificus]